MENTKTLNLGDHLQNGRKILITREEGFIAKMKIRMNEVELKYDKISIIVPPEILTINPPFLEVLFFNVIRKLGEKKFKERFIFDCQGIYKIDEDLQEAIDRILREAKMK